jgi:hypothetical protein
LFFSTQQASGDEEKNNREKQRAKKGRKDLIKPRFYTSHPTSIREIKNDVNVIDNMNKMFHSFEE